MIALAIAVTILATGCGGQDDSRARIDAPPSPYTGPPLSVVDVTEGKRGGGDPYSAVLSGTVTAGDGTKAMLTLEQFVELDEGGSVDCAGEASSTPFTLDDSEERRGTLEIAGWGTAELTIQRTTGTFESPFDPPSCVESVGTWTGTEGRLEGRNGSWTASFVQGVQQLTVDQE